MERKKKKEWLLFTFWCATSTVKKVTVEVPRYNLVNISSTEVNAMLFNSFIYRKKRLHRRDNSNYLYYRTVNLLYQGTSKWK